MEEIVAESFSTVLLQEKVIRTRYETDKSTFQKVIETLKQFISDLKQAIRGKRISNIQLLATARRIKQKYVCDVPTYEIEDALRALNNYLAKAENPNAQDVFNSFCKKRISLKKTLSNDKVFFWLFRTI